MAIRQAEYPQPNVLRHFPGRAQIVRNLAECDQSFRDMCQELGEAEAALARIEDVPVSVRAERQEECIGWINRLKREMEEALSATKVVSLSQQKVMRRS